MDERLRTHHDCQSPARLPRQQDEGGPATWIVAHTAARADSEVPTRGSGRVTNAANTGEQEMSSTRVLRRPWGGRTHHPPRYRRGCTGTNEAICCHGRGRVEPFDRSADPCRFSSGRPDLYDLLRARGRRRCSPNRPRHHATRVRLGRDRRSSRLHRHERPRGGRCAAAARRHPAGGHRRLDSRGAQPHRKRVDRRHRSRDGPRGHQG